MYFQVAGDPGDRACYHVNQTSVPAEVPMSRHWIRRGRNIFGTLFRRGRVSYLISPPKLACPPGKPSLSLHRKSVWNAQEHNSLFFCPFGNTAPLNKTSLTPVFSKGWLSGYFRGLKIGSLIHFYFAARIAVDFTKVYCGRKKRTREAVCRSLTRTYQREARLLKTVIRGWLRQYLSPSSLSITMILKQG